MDKIPDITSDRIKKLKELNISSVYQLAVQDPIELSSEYEDTSLDVEAASVLIANARKILIENEALTSEFTTADEILEKRNKLSRYATGSESFDNFLNGGFETQAITELAGEFGSGKSQICHTLCVAANQLMKSSLHEEDRHSSVGNIIFIDSENTFRADRVHQIAEQRGLDPFPILEKISHCGVYNSGKLESTIGMCLRTSKPFEIL